MSKEAAARKHQPENEQAPGTITVGAVPEVSRPEVTRPEVAEGAAPPAAPPKAAEVKPLPVSAYTLINDSSGTFGRIWGATIPAGVPWEHVLADEFWAHKANAFAPYDIITVRHANREYYARLLVLELRKVGTSAENNRVTVHLLERHDLKPADSGLDSHLALFAIRDLGASKKWCVIRVADQTIVHEGFDTIGDVQRARRLAAQNAAQLEAAAKRVGRG